jgi:hypothetical protein
MLGSGSSLRSDLKLYGEFLSAVVVAVVGGQCEPVSSKQWLEITRELKVDSWSNELSLRQSPAI